MESSIITVELFLVGISLNSVDGPVGSSGWGEAALDEGLVELSGRDDI